MILPKNSVAAGVHFLPSIVVGDLQILCHGENESTNEMILKCIKELELK
jgi:hypothetical protein